MASNVAAAKEAGSQVRIDSDLAGMARQVVANREADEKTLLAYLSRILRQTVEQDFLRVCEKLKAKGGVK